MLAINNIINKVSAILFCGYIKHTHIFILIKENFIENLGLKISVKVLITQGGKNVKFAIVPILESPIYKEYIKNYTTL